MNTNIALRPLTRSQSFQFGTWDIEARDWWDLLMIGVYDGEHYYHFRDVESFLAFILQKKYRYWRWFAHFGGRYDTNFVFDHIRANRPDLKLNWFCAGSMVLDMTIRSGDMIAKLRDSYRLLPASLDQLTKAFDVKHKKGKVDFANLEYNQTLIDYNEDDCIGLYEVLDSFFEQTGIRSETFASHALRVFRKDFLRQEIWKPHADIEEFVRRGYHGGRTEVFKRRADRVLAYDVNSMYPYVMQFPVPVRYIARSRHWRDKDGEYGFIDATVHWPDVYIPSLPVRGDKLYFPVGTIRGIWTSPELQRAMSHGCSVIKIHDSVWFETAELFKDYVAKLYKLKQTAGEPVRTITKFLLNSLYGKFGQSPEKRVYSTMDDAPDGAIPVLSPDGKPSGFAFMERTSNAAYILPHISAAITSAARMVLFERLDGHSFYCDTDSVFTSRKMPVGDKLGDWSLVGTGECEFFQPKLYKFAGVWKAKGLNREQSIDDYVKGQPNIVTRARSITEALRDNKPAMAHVTVEKYYREGKPKRAWDGDNDTRPWRYEELNTK